MVKTHGFPVDFPLNHRRKIGSETRGVLTRLTPSSSIYRWQKRQLATGGDGRFHGAAIATKTFKKKNDIY